MFAKKGCCFSCKTKKTTEIKSSESINTSVMALGAVVQLGECRKENSTEAALVILHNLTTTE